jgi:hypothetical protein
VIWHRWFIATTAAAMLLTACAEQPNADEAASPSTATSPGNALTETEPVGVALADAPAGDMRLWASTIGLPVSAAVRTSTPLARLADTPIAEREAVCRQVAADMDTIAPPQLLSAVAITADAETATLLVGDLSAKAELLTACSAGGPALDALIAEVAQTHTVAVAWLALLRASP